MNGCIWRVEERKSFTVVHCRELRLAIHIHCQELRLAIQKRYITSNCEDAVCDNEKQQKANPKEVAFVTLNEKYNGFRKLILVRNCKLFSAFGAAAGQDFTAVSR